jgi:hypothetical protein
MATGLVHLHEYQGPYRSVPTIGTLFVVNFVAATVIALALVAPVEHAAGRWGGPLLALLTLSGIALSGGSLVMLLISEHGTLFGFHEPGYDPSAIALSRLVEIAAVALLGVSLVIRFATRTRSHRW